jgi:hypothetical protein
LFFLIVGRAGARHFSIWTDRAGAGPLTLRARGL